MTEYWKSYAKKFCEICKCWFADNRVSAERHEQGLRHKAMVQQRLRESAKKAKDKEVEDHDLRMTLLAMEQAARASITSGEEREVPMLPAPRIISSKKQPVESEEDDAKAKLKEQKRKIAELKKRSKQSQFWSAEDGDEKGTATEGEELALGGDAGPVEWVQAETPDGQFYYWHIYSGETCWDQPQQFYTTAQYADHYANIVSTETPAANEDQGGQLGTKFTNDFVQSSSADLSIAGSTHCQPSDYELINPTFVHQMTAAEVNSQMASQMDDDDKMPPPPVKKYYGMREKHDFFGRGPPKERRNFDEDNDQQPILTREERRKIRRERKAMNDRAEDGTQIPEGLVELKVETPLSATEEWSSEGVAKASSTSACHPLGPWISVKKEEKRPDLNEADTEHEPKEKKRAKRYDDLPEQSYGQGSVDYSQAPAELLEVAEMDPEDLAFRTKQMGPQQQQAKKSAKGKVVGFRKPGSSHATKSFRSANKSDF